jgi:hypothetical protein
MMGDGTMHKEMEKAKMMARSLMGHLEDIMQ